VSNLHGNNYDVKIMDSGVCFVIILQVLVWLEEASDVNAVIVSMTRA
jgi:hypothetical protein